MPDQDKTVGELAGRAAETTEEPLYKYVESPGQNETARQLAEYIIMTFKPHERPVVIMWREVMNGFNLKSNPEFTGILKADNRYTHESWLQYGPKVVVILESKYKITVVKVGNLIRKVADHGHYPGVSKRYTPERYKKCLCGPHAPTFGLVCFPKGSDIDHPLVVEAAERRCKSGTSHLKNSKFALDKANDYKVMSNHIHDTIERNMVPPIKAAFMDKYPLFPRELDAIPAEEPLEQIPEDLDETDHEEIGS